MGIRGHVNLNSESVDIKTTVFGDHLFLAHVIIRPHGLIIA